MQTRFHRRRKTNIVTGERRECDSGAFECSPFASDHIGNEGSAHESPKTLRALHEPFAVDIGNHSAPAAGDRDTQVLAAADVLQGRGSTERLKVSSLSARLAQQIHRLQDCGLTEEDGAADDHALLSRVLVGGYVLDDR